MKPSRVFLVLGPLCVVLASGCKIGQKFNNWKGLKDGDTLCVLPLRDHFSNDPRDSEKTGLICHEILTRELKKMRGVTIDSYTPDTYDPKKGFCQDDAVKIAKGRDADYVLYGRCTEYYHVAPMTFRRDKGGIDVEICRVADGTLVYGCQKIGSKMNWCEPRNVIESIAKRMARTIRPR